MKHLNILKFNHEIKPPVAKKDSIELKLHGHTRTDDYYWMKNRKEDRVYNHLNKEKGYHDKVMSPLKDFSENLFFELKSRIKQDDSSVPYFFNGYWYITRFEEEKQYPIYIRKKDSMENPEELLFDCNKMAKEHEYFDLRGISVSPDNSKVAYGIDTQSRRMYTLYVKDLHSDKVLDFKVENTDGRGIWAQDNKHLFFATKNVETLRTERIYRADIFDKTKSPTEVYFEKDETFSVYCSGSKSREYIFISSVSTLTTEHQFLSSKKPFGEFQVIQKRIRGLEYGVSQYENHFYIVTNINGAKNFKIVRTPIEAPTSENWEVIIPHSKNVLIEDLEIFHDFMVITERRNGLSMLRVKSWDDTEDYHIPFKGETYTVYSGVNPDYRTSKLRFGYTSLSTPSSIYEYDMVNKELKLLKRLEVMDSKFDINNYIEKRLWAVSRDDQKIPISLIYHKDTLPSINTPLIQYGYGAYGYTIDPSFSSNRLSLLDRGYIFAIAHVRGGEYLGRKWYDTGKLLSKKNTFNDFIDCSRFLIEKGYTSSNHLYALGGSAGGLLVGAVVNQAPKLYNGIIAAVPFVDVVTTMLDSSIPLTTSEYDEWGNPNDEAYYKYILSYSPYDNVKKQEYPHIYVTTGLHDSQVQYWEPVKWVSKLREHNTTDSLVLLDINLSTGHSGSSGRFNALKEISRQYSFLLALEGLV